jgi:CheY-like chemotaxis protein
VTVSRILIAEDNPADVYLLREAINQNGDAVEMMVVSDGEEALDFVEARGKFAEAPKPDLIVLDLNLPKSDGSDVLKRIREKPEYQKVPVVVLTSSDSPKDRTAASTLGAELFLTKPSDLDQFLGLGEVLLSYVGRGKKSPPVR